MKRLAVATSLAMAAIGCDAADNAIVLRGVVAPMVMQVAGPGGQQNTTCLLPPGEPMNFLPGVSLDTASSYKLTAPIAVTNNLAEVMQNVGTQMIPVMSNIANHVTPLRYELRWECDSTGFTSDLGPLIVPSFDPLRAFCLDRRADVNSEFIGFDFVPIDTPANIPPQQTGTVRAKLIPFQLGAAFADTFRIARLADECCRAPGTNCDGQAPMNTGCQELENIFNTLDPNGQFGLEVQSQTPGTPSEDLVRYRPFAIYDGAYITGVSPNNGLGLGAQYPLRARGVMELQTADGFSVSSSELLTQVNICHNCGPVVGATRGPLNFVTDVCLWF